MYLLLLVDNKIEPKRYVQSFQTLPNEYPVPTVDQDTMKLGGILGVSTWNDKLL